MAAPPALGVVFDTGRNEDEMDTNGAGDRLALLMIEHRDLDEVITRLADDPMSNQLQLQRLKKRKLALKDQIMLLRSQTLPDIIA